MCDRIFVILVLVLGLASAHSARAQPGDAENGKDVFKVCRPCHQVGPAAKNGIGPTLNGIVGSKAGTIPGFTYSEANKEVGTKGLVWTEDNLFKYLEESRGLYAGQQDDLCRHEG